MSRSTRHPGVHTMSPERVLLVTKHKITGAERCDWWPSREEAENSDMIIVKELERKTVEVEKKEWDGFASALRFIFGKSGTQDWYLRKRPLDQKEFFEPVDDKWPKKK